MWSFPTQLCGILQCLQNYSLFSHASVFQDVHIDEERLLVFTHPTQKQSPFLQQALETENKVKGASSTLQLKYIELDSNFPL